MKKKIVGILVCMLVMITAFSAMATRGKQEQSSFDQSTGHRGGLFTQLPMDPGYDTYDYYLFPSCVGLDDSQAYESFWNVTGPIRCIHWWGFSLLDDGSGWPWPPGDPVGMTFNITFYEDNNNAPGNLVRSYNDIRPSITTTGIIYPELEDISLELYFFEYNLTSSCNLSNGWVSILSTGSDNDCHLGWMSSADGDNIFTYKDRGGYWDLDFWDCSLVLTDGEKTDISIVDVTGGAGVTVQLKNNGNTTVDNFPVNIVVKGGLLKKIEVKVEDTISGLAPDATTSLQTGMFFGFGKISIFVIGDGIAAYKHGIQLFTYTIIQNT